jgi:hypothetical protein
MPAEATALPMERGYTPNELAAILRIGPDRIRSMIASGELGALNLAPSRCHRPRHVVLPHHLREFEQARRVVTPPPKPARRKKRTTLVDYYPD